MGTAVQGGLLKGVGVEVGCEGSGAVERKERPCGQEVGTSAACSETLRRGNWAWKTERASLFGTGRHHCGRQSCREVEAGALGPHCPLRCN